jgi:hypothetical protein
MATRQRIVAGNWKMNLSYLEGRDLVMDITARISPSDTMVVLAPPFVHLNNIGNIIHGIANLKLGAQDCHWAESGAFTGAISARMLASVEVNYVIIGHSERRQYFGETDAQLAQKLDAALVHGLIPIFCCGELLEAREADEQEAVVAAQLHLQAHHAAGAFGFAEHQDEIQPALEYKGLAHGWADPAEAKDGRERGRARLAGHDVDGEFFMRFTSRMRHHLGNELRGLRQQFY